jgi:hypothetical protein
MAFRGYQDLANGFFWSPPACALPEVRSLEAVCVARLAVNQNLEPLPGVLTAPISPSIFAVNALAIARPRPVPPYRRVNDPAAWVNGAKSFLR